MYKLLLTLFFSTLSFQTFAESLTFEPSVSCQSNSLDYLETLNCVGDVIVNIELNRPKRNNAAHCYTKGSFKVYDESGKEIYQFSSKSDRRFHGKRTISSHLIPLGDGTKMIKFVFKSAPYPVGITKLNIDSYPLLQAQILRGDLISLILSFLLVASGFYVLTIGAHIKLKNIIYLSVFSIFMGLWTFYTRDPLTRIILLPQADPYAFDIGIISAFTAMFFLIKIQATLPYSPKFRFFFKIGGYIAVSFMLVSIACGYFYIPVRKLDPAFNFFMFIVLFSILLGSIYNRKKFSKLQLTSLVVLSFGGLWDAIFYLTSKAIPYLHTTIFSGFHLAHPSLLLSINIFFMSICKSKLRESKEIPASKFLRLIAHEIKNTLFKIQIEYDDAERLESDTLEDVKHSIKFLCASDHVHRIEKEYFEIGLLHQIIPEPNLVVYSDKELVEIVFTNLVRNSAIHGQLDSMEVSLNIEETKVWIIIKNESIYHSSKKISKGWGLDGCYFIAKILGETLIQKNHGNIFISEFSISRRKLY